MGHNYLLRDNEQLNYRREQSSRCNIKQFPVRSKKLLKHDQFLSSPPPPRDDPKYLHTQHQHFVQTRTISICSVQMLINYSENTLFIICIKVIKGLSVKLCLPNLLVWFYIVTFGLEERCFKR